jgi:hypothetical protein
MNEDDKCNCDPDGSVDKGSRLAAMRVEVRQIFTDLKNLTDETYDELDRPFLCQYCDEIIINKPQVVTWGGSFYHLEKCLIRAARERLTL